MGGIPLPAGYHSVNPYIVVDDAERLIDFLDQVFGAAEQGRSLRSDGRIDHADVRIGDSLVMLSEASQQYPARPCVHFVYVPDVDATYRAALAAGATSILEPTEQSWGDRACASSTPSTTAGGSQPTCETSPRPTSFRLRDGCSARLPPARGPEGRGDRARRRPQRVRTTCWRPARPTRPSPTSWSCPRRRSTLT